VSRKQVGLRIEAPPLKGPNTTFWPISQDGKTVGKVTSAVYSPRLEQNIALAMVEADTAEIGTVVEVLMPRGPASATIVERPFFDPKKKLAAG
jgi:glycine cleavage system aminomethyltransferase T